MGLNNVAEVERSRIRALKAEANSRLASVLFPEERSVWLALAETFSGQARGLSRPRARGEQAVAPSGAIFRSGGVLGRGLKEGLDE